MAESSGGWRRGAPPPTSEGERQPGVEGAQSPGAWLELSVEADIDEHGLQALLNILHAAFVNGADDGARADTLDGVLFEHAVIEKGDSVFEFFTVDDEAGAALDVFFSSDEFFDAFDDSECHKGS